MDPNSIVVDFTSAGDAWYDSVELTKFIAGDNAITEIDASLADEFGALKLLDVSGTNQTQKGEVGIDGIEPLVSRQQIIWTS